MQKHHPVPRLKVTQQLWELMPCCAGLQLQPCTDPAHAPQGLHSLFPEGLLLLLTPHVHHLPVLVDLHGVVHEAVHVDEFNALLVSIVQHGRDDGELAHLLLQVLWGKQREQLVSTTGPQGLQGQMLERKRTGRGTGEFKGKH